MWWWKVISLANSELKQSTPYPNFVLWSQFQLKIFPSLFTLLFIKFWFQILFLLPNGLLDEEKIKNHDPTNFHILKAYFNHVSNTFFCYFGFSNHKRCQLCSSCILEMLMIFASVRWFEYRILIMIYDCMYLNLLGYHLHHSKRSSIWFWVAWKNKMITKFLSWVHFKSSFQILLLHLMRFGIWFDHLNVLSSSRKSHWLMICDW